MEYFINLFVENWYYLYILLYFLQFLYWTRKIYLWEKKNFPERNPRLNWENFRGNWLFISIYMSSFISLVPLLPVIWFLFISFIKCFAWIIGY